MPKRPAITFPADFIWGAATASYQIEGAHDAHGKGRSIWDEFVERPGVIEGGDHARRACDHYSLFETDVALMKEIGLKAYRFSLAWTRLLPNGVGASNPDGIDFYNRLIDALLEAGIEPCPTLFHWDLPQALQDKGGWASAEIADWFADYTELATRAYGDRIKTWFTLNEPNVFASAGHVLGLHAPGLQDPAAYLKCIHHQNLAHGRAVEVFRNTVPDGRIGIVINMGLFEGESGSGEDATAAETVDALYNKAHLDPILKGSYPLPVRTLMEGFGVSIDERAVKTISQRTDFLGVNFYSRRKIAADPSAPLGACPVEETGDGSENLTAMGWRVDPEGFYLSLKRLHDEYAVPIIVTENGVAYEDQVEMTNGQKTIQDPERIAFFQDYLRALDRALQDGVNISGYFAWSLLDNFEWAEGYRPRFGLIHVDFETLERTPKESARWFRRLIDANTLAATE
ncbi:MAG: GH1 family beta-glucosidase [Pseudomonadota bacterium]